MGTSPGSAAPRGGPPSPGTRSGPWRHGPWLAVLLLALGAYLTSLPNDFVRDDKLIVRDNPLVQEPGRAGELLRTGYWSAKGVEAGLYRPATMLSYVLNRALAGPGPLSFHLVNVAAHGAVSLLVFALLAAVTRSTRVAWVSAALFAVHPVHVEAVANVVGRADLLAALAVLAALLAHEAGARARGPRLAALRLGAGAAFLLGLLSKEAAIVFPALPPLQDALRRRQERGRGERRPGRRGDYLMYLAVALGYVALRTAVLGGLTRAGIAYQANPLAPLEGGERLVAALGLVPRYARLFLLPLRLQCDYSVAEVLPSPSVLDPWALGGLVLVAGACGVLAWQWRRAPEWSYLMAFTLVCYSVVSNLPFPIGTIMGERLLYLPSVGLCALAGLGLVRLHERLRRRIPLHPRLAGTLLAALLGTLGWRTVTRNLDWRSDASLYLADVVTAPRSAKLQANAGWVLLQAGDAPGAIARLEESLRIYPTPEATYTLARAHAARGDRERRRDLYRRTAETWPSSFWGASAAGWLAVWEGRLEQARDRFRAAADLHPFDGSARYNLGILELELGDAAAAARELERATGLGPASERTRLESLGEALERLGRFGDAASVWARAAGAFPEERARWERRRRLAWARERLEAGDAVAADPAAVYPGATEDRREPGDGEPRPGKEDGP